VKLINSFLMMVVSVSLAMSYTSDNATSPPLELKVNELKTTSFFPGAKAYSATLTNTTTQSIRLEAVQMPGGYLGNGTFYPCEIQFWNGKTRQWRSIPPTNRRSDNSAGLFFHAEMKPNEALEVCRTLLVKDRIKGGKCARFALTFQWNHKPDILSEPFVIPDPDKPEKRVGCPQ